MSDTKALLPKLPDPKLTSSRAQPDVRRLARYDAVIVLHQRRGKLTDLEISGADALAAVAARTGNANQVLAAVPGAPATPLAACRIDRDAAAFDRDTACRKTIKALAAASARSIAVVVDRKSLKDHSAAVSSMVTALMLADFRMPKFGKQPKRLAPLAITVFEPKKTNLAATRATARGNCLARWLTAMPPNKLDALGYRAVAEALAKQHRWQYRYHSAATLKRRGAGAFTAVAQGNETNDAGIVELRYRPKTGKKRPKVALVGKGIIFDTGGTNLKPFEGMLGMHVDMGGSAVAIATLATLSELGVAWDIDAWLGITENRTGPQAYKPQDVVTALNGKTIQTIHTDAEGRMVLADTLTLAGRAKPDCILDFATLTGAAINAVTTRYGAIFTNRPSLHPTLKTAGADSGERVWPFPIGAAFIESLDSETADIKQCAPGGGGDHILAATFLNEFVPPDVPWVHLDLSACEHKGGLGAAPTDITGFGVRYATELLTGHLREVTAAPKG